jgi:hypothetical protein
MKVENVTWLIMRRQLLESFRDNVDLEIRRIEDLILQEMEKENVK